MNILSPEVLDVVERTVGLFETAEKIKESTSEVIDLVTASVAARTEKMSITMSHYDMILLAMYMALGVEMYEELIKNAKIITLEDFS